MKGKPSAIKKVIQIFEKEGLLEPPPGKQIHGVLVAPKTSCAVIGLHRPANDTSREKVDDAAT
jgi:hypothetical protein